jgi:hypothetical protein
MKPRWSLRELASSNGQQSEEAIDPDVVDSQHAELVGQSSPHVGEKNSERSPLILHAVTIQPVSIKPNPETHLHPWLLTVHHGSFICHFKDGMAAEVDLLRDSCFQHGKRVFDH